MSFSMSGPTGRASGLKRTPYQQISLPTMDQGQNELFSSTMRGMQPGMSDAMKFFSQMASGNPQMFEQMEAPAMRQFGALQGNIASRFSGMGSGARHSSGFQNTMGEAGADLAERLAGNRMAYQRDASQQLMDMAKNLWGTKTFESALMPKEIPFLKQLLGLLGGGMSQAGGMFGGMKALKMMGLT